MKKAVSILLVCTLLISIGTVSIFADTVIQSERNIYAGITGNNGNAGIQIYAYSLKPYIFDSSEQGFTRIYNAGTGLQYSTIQSWTTVIAQEYVFQVRMYNYSDDIVVYNSATLSILPQRPAVTDPIGTNHTYGYSIKDMSNNSDYSYQVNTNGYIQIKSSNGESIHVPPRCIRVFDFVVTSYCNEMSSVGRFLDGYDAPLSSVAFESGAAIQVNNNFRVYDIDYNLYAVNQDLDSIYNSLITIRSEMNNQLNLLNQSLITNNQYTSSINSNVQSILDQYTANSQNAQNVTSGTQTNDQTISNIATNEDTWFSQNNQALQATGINNFNYTPTVMSGMSVISDQFTQLWLALGDWNFVYTFSMMIGLVMLILRHNPQRKKSSSSGNSGGKSNATSS